MRKRKHDDAHKPAFVRRHASSPTTAVLVPWPRETQDQAWARIQATYQDMQATRQGAQP